MATDGVNPLVWNVPIVNKDGTPTLDFMRKWGQQRNANETALAGINSYPASAKDDGTYFYIALSDSSGQLLLDASRNPVLIKEVFPVSAIPVAALEANPTATAGPAAVNGVATTFMRSDAAPAVQKASASQFGIVEVDGATIVAPGGVIGVIASVPLAGSPTTTTQSQSDNSTKIATTAYTDLAVSNAVAGINPAVAVQAATIAAGDTSSFVYNNGVAGVGATLTGPTANVAVTIDGFTFTILGQRLLVKNDTQSPSGAFNGVYFLTTLQAPLVKPVFTRALDYDQPSDMNNTGAIPVVSGTANALTSWLLTSTVATVGASPLTYAQFSYAPTAGTFSFADASGAGLSLVGGFSYVKVGKLCVVSGSVAWPVNSNGNNASLSGLPFAPVNLIFPYYPLSSSVIIGLLFFANTTTTGAVSQAGVGAMTNSQLSGVTAYYTFAFVTI